MDPEYKEKNNAKKSCIGTFERIPRNKNGNTAEQVLNSIPLDCENIIMDYIYQLEHTEKYKTLISELTFYASFPKTLINFLLPKRSRVNFI